MRKHFAILALVGAMLAVLLVAPVAAARPATGGLSAIPVTGTTSASTPFTGVLSITSFALNSAGQLVASGTLTNTLTGVITPFTNVLVTPIGACPVLSLQIGAIHLDLLGLVVNLAPIDLNIIAQSGPGNLLGNLLCAVVHLLDNGGPLAGLTNLLNRLNGLLAGL